MIITFILMNIYISNIYIYLLTLQSLNRTNWFKPASGGSATGCQATCNKLPPMAFKVVAKTVWFICTAR